MISRLWKYSHLWDLKKNENFLFFIFESIEILIIVIIAEVILMLFFFLNHYHIDVNYTTSKQY